MTALTHDIRESRLGPGIGLALLSASSFGLAGPLARGLLDAGWTSAAAVAARVLLAAAVLTPIAAYQLRGRWGLLRRTAPLIAAFGIVAVAGCQLAYFTAVAHMDVGVALLVEYTAPVAVVGWMWLRHGERPTRLTVLGAALGTAGLLLVLDLASDTRASLVGILWALAAMVGAATFFVLSARRGDGLPGAVLAAGGLLLGGLTLLAAGAVGVVPFVMTTAPVVFVGFTAAWWPTVLVLGVVTAALAYVTGVAANRRLGARLASFVSLVEVMMALLLAWLLLGQAPRPVQLVGGLFILAGVVVVRRGERRMADA